MGVDHPKQERGLPVKYHPKDNYGQYVSIFLLWLIIHTDSTPRFIFRVPNGFNNLLYSNPISHASTVQHFHDGKNNGFRNGRNRMTSNIASE